MNIRKLSVTTSNKDDSKSFLFGNGNHNIEVNVS